MSLYNYSQITYPKLSLIDGDTVILLSLENLKKANVIFNERDMYKEMADTLSENIEKCLCCIQKRDMMIDSLYMDNVSRSIDLIDKTEEIELEKQKKFKWKLSTFIMTGVATTFFIILM